MNKLFSPLKIRSITLKNRIAISPMCMYSSPDGFATDFHLAHLGSRAIGGAGLIIQEATAIVPEGRITHMDMGLWKDEHIEKSKQIVEFIHSQGASAGIQLAHAGRKASHEVPWDGSQKLAPDHKNGWTTEAPSPVPFREDEPGLPSELSLEDIKNLKKEYVAATRRSEEIGYDVLEIHAAHGYLMHQFYSPLSNNRTDEYGGSFENRIRFLIEVTKLVRKEWGEEKPLFVRISATDWVEGGWTIEDSVKLSMRLKECGVDLIDTSTGGNVTGVKIPLTPGYQVEFADKIKKGAKILTGAVGLITSAEQAEEILESDRADLILIARESLREPNFALRAAHELDEKIEWPNQYARAEAGM